MNKRNDEFVEMPTLTMIPHRKKGLPKGVIIAGAAIMILGVIVIAIALLGTG